MKPEVLIAGQGLAGSLLGWQLEKAGIPFAIVDPGHVASASVQGAGMLNPITGRRMTRSAGVDELLPVAREAYREIERALGVVLWRELRIRRLFSETWQREALAEKRPVLAPYVGAVDEDGFWIEGAARVDIRAMLAGLRARWIRQGRLREGRIDGAVAGADCVIDCTGMAAARDSRFGFLPWQFSKGELLEIAVDGLEDDVALNKGHWVLPVAAGRAWVGATHVPGETDASPTASARAELEASARGLLEREFRVVDHRAGVRVNLPDRLPVAGRHPTDARLGLINGLGAKGALWAPALARQWVRHLTEGAPFAENVAVGRFSSSSRPGPAGLAPDMAV